MDKSTPLIFGTLQGKSALKSSILLTTTEHMDAFLCLTQLGKSLIRTWKFGTMRWEKSALEFHALWSRTKLIVSQYELLVDERAT